MLKEGDTGNKNEALQILLDRYQIDSSNLSPQQKYQLVMEQIFKISQKPLLRLLFRLVSKLQ